ncbi:MAG TPA: RNA polymerase sigma factor [Ilumatobacteraceae bacterium]|jgi:RNA polymerase sigma-70 factor (ECF subfamily)
MTTERTQRTDTDLVALARAGDTAAFGALVGRHQAAAIRLAAAISGSTVDAADIAQEAFVKAHRSLARLSDPSTVRSWMLRIVANEAKNTVRGRDRRRRRDQLYGAWVVAPSPDPETTAVDADTARRLALALGRVGPRDREVLAYRYFAGLSEAETAVAAGIALGTVKSRTARALERLRTEMEIR